MGSSRLRTLLARLLLIAVSSTLAVLLCEGIVRWLAPQQLVVIRPDIWIPDGQGLGWKQAAGVDMTINTGERTVRFLTDARGHRIGTQTRQTRRRVLALGDSFLAAIQVENEDLFTELLADRLPDRFGDTLSIVNTGVGGWGPSHYLIKARDELTRYPYEAMLVFVFLGNDMERRRFEHFPPKLSNDTSHRLRFPRSMERVEWIEGVAYPVNDYLESHSHLFKMAKDRMTFLLMRVGLSARQFQDSLMVSEADSDRWRTTADVLVDVDRVAREHGVPALFVLIPGVCQVNEEVLERTLAAAGVARAEIDVDQPSRLLLPLLQEQGVAALDATPAFREAKSRSAEPLYGRIDTHLSPAGHRVLAGIIEDPVVELLRSRSATPPEYVAETQQETTASWSGTPGGRRVEVLD